MITLISGEPIDETQLVFSRETYHFFFNGHDVTNDIYRRDKQAIVPSFDVAKENLRLSAELGHGGSFGSEPLSESTTGIFVEQLATDPLSAPIAALDSGVKQLLGSSGIKTMLVIGGAVLVGVILLRK